jgi:hypothetical protein
MSVARIRRDSERPAPRVCVRQPFLSLRQKLDDTRPNSTSRQKPNLVIKQLERRIQTFHVLGFADDFFRTFAF